VFIIFEGCDLSGKSTIIDYLYKNYRFGLSGWKIFNYFKIRARFPDTWLQNIDLCAEIEYNCLKQCRDSYFVLDRFYVSSIIYNQVLDRKYDTSYINPDDFKNDLMIYVSVSEDVLIKRCETRGDDKKILERLMDLNKAYIEYFKDKEVLRLNGNDEPCENTKLIIHELAARGF